MLGFDDYASRKSGRTIGEQRKYYSDMIMEQSFDGDIATRDMYFFDFYHDPDPTEIVDLDMRLYKDIPHDRVKYIISTHQSLDKDTVPFKIQFKPSHECIVPYYDEMFRSRYGAIYPIGLYVAIPDEKGKYNKWLVVDVGDSNAPQFPTYQILPCDYVLRWVHKNKKYSMAGCLRSQNSYNSGVYRDRIFEHTEDQYKITLPLNRITETIEYNKRVIIDAFVETEPRCWRVTKLNRVAPTGVNRITFYQSAFDPNTDYIEHDDDGNIVGFWADYYTENGGVQAQEDENASMLRGEIKYSGAKAQVKLGGGYKKLSVLFYDGDKPIDHQYGQWRFYVDNVEESEKFEIRTTADSQDIGVNEVKIKFPNENNQNDSYLGKKIHIVYESTSGVSPELDMDIIGL